MVVLAFAAACGGDDGKKKQRREGEEAGAGYGGELIVTAGSMSDAGMPPEGGNGGVPSVPAAGQGGEPVVPMGGVGGEPGVSGAGGDGGEPAVCCKRLTCAEAAAECGPYIDDGCGGWLDCQCPPGKLCDGTGTCSLDCVPIPDLCMVDQSKCGATTDNCGNPINCPTTCGGQPDVKCIDGSCRACKSTCDAGDCGMVADYCGSFLDCPDTCADTGGKCMPGGYCQTCKTMCAPEDCGMMPDNCGGTIDCTATVCDGKECDGSGHCCLPSDPVATCGDAKCGNFWDGCKAIQCGATCTETQICDTSTGCHESVCKKAGYTCGTVANAGFANGFESCGYCGDNEFCDPELLICIPICQ